MLITSISLALAAIATACPFTCKLKDKRLGLVSAFHYQRPWKSGRNVVKLWIGSLSVAASCSHLCRSELSTMQLIAFRARNEASNWSANALARALQNRGGYSLHAAVWKRAVLISSLCHSRRIRKNSISTSVHWFGQKRQSDTQKACGFGCCTTPFPLAKSLKLAVWILQQQTNKCRPPNTGFFFILRTSRVFAEEYSTSCKV